MAELTDKDLSGKVIEAAIAVDPALGPGFGESVCEDALCVESSARGIKLGQQKAIKVFHRDAVAGLSPS